MLLMTGKRFRVLTEMEKMNGIVYYVSLPANTFATTFTPKILNVPFRTTSIIYYS